MPPESESRVIDIQWRFGDMATYVQQHQRKGEVMLVEDFYARVGKASQLDDIIGQHGGSKKDTNGVEMLKFLACNER